MARRAEQVTPSALVRGLDSWWPRRRRRAARALGVSGDPGAAAPLVYALEDRRPAIRSEAARSLGRLAAPEAFAGLARHARHDVDPGVRESAAAALALLGDARVAETLGQVLRDSERRVRVAAVDALAALGDSRAAITLIAGLVDPDLALRERVADLLAGTRDVRAAAAFIRGLRPPAEEGHAEPQDAHSPGAAAWLAPDRVGKPLLYAAGSLSDVDRRAAAQALEDAAVSLLRRVMAGARGPGDGGLWEQLDDPWALYRLLRLMSTEPLRGPLSRDEAEAVLWFCGRSAARVLIGALDDADLRVRQNAERALRWVPPGTLVLALMAVLGGKHHRETDMFHALAERELDLRERAIQEWAEMGRRGEHTLRTLLGHEREWVRLWAAEALGRMGMAGPALRLRPDGPSDGIGLVWHVLAGYAGEADVAPLKAALGSWSLDARLAAAGALGELGAAAMTAVSPLAALIASESRPQARAIYHRAMTRILKRAGDLPTELEASSAPEGWGTELLAGPAPPEGRGTEPEAVDPPVHSRGP